MFASLFVGGVRLVCTAIPSRGYDVLCFCVGFRSLSFLKAEFKDVRQYVEWPNRADFEKLSSRCLKDQGKSIQTRTAASVRNCCTQSAVKKSFSLCFVECVLEDCDINVYTSVGICDANERQSARWQFQFAGEKSARYSCRGRSLTSKGWKSVACRLRCVWPTSERIIVSFTYLSV